MLRFDEIFVVVVKRIEYYLTQFNEFSRSINHGIGSDFEQSGTFINSFNKASMLTTPIVLVIMTILDLAERPLQGQSMLNYQIMTCLQIFQLGPQHLDYIS